MKQHLCDICGNNLFQQEESRSILGMFFSRIFVAKRVIEEHFLSPGFGNKHDLEVCSRCFDEFRAFVQRKNIKFIPKDKGFNRIVGAK